MNNNNHFNTNNWVGTTHLDFFKNSSNALSNYTLDTSNILENHILITSNINYFYTSNSSNSNIYFTSNTSNLIIEKYDKLIKEETQEITFPIPATLKHTYIYNNNNAGEIRFQNKAYLTDILGFPPGTPNYKAKIDFDGKLKLYWVYDPLVSLIYLGGWHEPLNEIAGLIADSINQGGILTALEGQIVINKQYTDTELTLIWAYIEGVQAGIITPGQTTITPAENARDMLSWGTPEIPPTPSTPGIPASPIQNANAISTFNQRVQQLSAARDVIRNSTLVRISDALLQYIVQNPLTSFILGTGFTTAGIAYAILQGIEYNRYYTGVIENVIDQNSNLSAGVRLSLHNINQSNIIASNLIDYCSNTYKFGISQGFTNSNIITQQYLNAINTNELKLNQTNISNIFVNSNALSNINLNQGFVNSNISNQQFISNLKCDNLFFNNSNISNVYASSNAVKDIIIYNTPQVSKRSAFYCVLNNVIYPNGGDVAYYAYHINLNNYTKIGYLEYTSDPYRIFNITCFYAPSYFQMRNTSGLPDICDYKIFMSYKQNSGGSGTKTGLNICALGSPQSYHLDTIPPTRLFLLRNASENFNYLTILSTLSADVRCIIQDELN